VTPLPRKLPASLAAVAASLLAGIAALGGLALLLPVQGRIIFIDSASILINLAAVGFLLRRSREGGSARPFYLLIALALAIHSGLAAQNFLSNHGLSWFRLEFRLSFFLHLSGPALQAIALFFWPTARSGRALRWREFLDALLFSTSLFLTIWLAGLGHLVSGASLSFFQKIAQLVFALDYTLLMCLVLYRGLNAPGRFASPLGWLLAAFTVVSAGNLVWIGLFLRGLYYPGHALDIVGMLVPVLYLLAALAPIPSERRSQPRRPTGTSLALPYLPFLLALPLVVDRILHLEAPQDSVALWLGVGMFGLLLLRQLVALWDSQDFSRSLEALVQQRTLALEESQAMLLRTQRMNILATLGAGLAHDLKNLLSVVGLSTELMEEDLRAGRPSAQKDLDALRGASSQATELVKKLLAFGQRGELQPQLFDLRDRVQGMAKLLEKLATPIVQVRWELGLDPLYLEMDPVQIEQILVNLVANARDAMPGGGRLLIRTEHCQGPEGKHQAALTVADSGIGIPPENLDRLFDAFFTTKDPGKGTGLGLASVKAIADECGATITVVSEPGAGTTFTARFPRVDLLGG